MNKKELIEEFKKEIEEVKKRTNWNENFKNYEKGKKSGLRYGLSLVEKLDEPELPVIPQFVADWIERSKQKGDKLVGVMLYFYVLGIDGDINKYIKKNYETFVRAWLDGYTIEKESIKTRQVLVKFFDNEEYKTELTEDAARELIEFLEANKK